MSWEKQKGKAKKVLVEEECEEEDISNDDIREVTPPFIRGDS